MVYHVQVYPRLSERLGVKDHVMVLNIMLQKIATNLKAFASCEDVVSHTLNLFQASVFTAP
jgi:exportin-7